MNTPPTHALARRGITGNVRGYSIVGDYAQPNPLAFDISMGVRRGDTAFKQEIEHVLEQDRGAIDAILAQYYVPLSPGQGETGEDARP